MPFTYWDGDEPVTVYLKAEAPDTVAQQLGDAAGDGKLPPELLASATAAAGQGEELIFVSESGEEMSLPGGVIVLLDPDWSAAQVSGFFADHSIEWDGVSELGWIGNGYLVDADPGLPSLQLANSLVGQPGVEMSTPDWAVESALK